MMVASPGGDGQSPFEGVVYVDFVGGGIAREGCLWKGIYRSGHRLRFVTALIRNPGRTAAAM